MYNLKSIYFGQKHADFNYKDFDLIKTISRLAKKHSRQCENSCNGVGYVNNKRYYTGSIDTYAKQKYGYDVISGYINNTDETIFDREIERIQDKINKLIETKKTISSFVYNDKSESIPVRQKFKVEYQHDPRGNTVKLYYNDSYVDIN